MRKAYWNYIEDIISDTNKTKDEKPTATRDSGHSSRDKDKRHKVWLH